MGRARERAEQLPGVTARVSCSGPLSSPACAMGVPAEQGDLEPAEPISTNEPSQEPLQPSSGGSSHGCGSAEALQFGQWGLRGVAVQQGTAPSGLFVCGEAMRK